MDTIQERYINLFTDYGFKKLSRFPSFDSCAFHSMNLCNIIYYKAAKTGGDTMSKYSIQFLKGLSIFEFNSLFSTEEQCEEKVFKLKLGDCIYMP